VAFSRSLFVAASARKVATRQSRTDDEKNKIPPPRSVASRQRRLEGSCQPLQNVLAIGKFTFRLKLQTLRLKTPIRKNLGAKLKLEHTQYFYAGNLLCLSKIATF